MKKLLFLKIFLFFLIFPLFFTTRVFASEYFFEEDFETLDKWGLLNGSWDYWSLVNEGVEARISTRYRISSLVPKDEFWQEVNEYEVDFIFHPLDDVDKTFAVGMMEDAASFYDFHFFSNQLIVEDVRDGFSIHSETMPFPLEVGRDHFIKIIFREELIELFIDEELIFYTGSNWPEIKTGGKFSIRVGTGSRYPSANYFSQIRVKNLDQSDFVSFKQTDSTWADEIYDHAELWTAYPKIANWGCALTSVSMVLNYYGHQEMPGGELLNPGTVNQWLIGEADGYVGDGLLNWLAISRLSRILSELNAMPKLEFLYFSADQLGLEQKLKEQLELEQVQIVAVPGHFLLVNDYDQDLDDFLIQDPLYDYWYLSEHNQNINSLRIFEPSFTDLSYFLIVLPKEVSYFLRDEEGNNLLDYFIVEESIVYEEESVGDDYVLIYYQKPEDLNFNLIFETSNLNKELLKKMKIFTYQDSGDLSQFDFQDLYDQDFSKIKSLEINIDYFKNEESQFSHQFNDKTFQELANENLQKIKVSINQAFEEAKLSFYLFYQINQLIFSIEEKQMGFEILDKFISFYNLNFETI